ncbi:MAG: autotransporter domain-containing protein [Rickettsiales bacterium]|nr:autotransporter domain-containing protein [Rickettsiales bacterium]
MFLVVAFFFKNFNVAQASDISGSNTVSGIPLSDNDSANFLDDGSLEINQNIILENITNTTSGDGTVTFGTNDTTLSITGDVEDIKLFESTNNAGEYQGTLTFDGTADQTINTIMGEDSANRIKDVNINNNSGVVSFILDSSDRSYVGNLNFTNSSATATFDISHTLQINGNITATSDSLITGSVENSRILLDGTSDQVIEAKLGTSDSRFYDLVMTSNKSGKVTISQDSYVERFIGQTSSSAELVADAAFDSSLIRISSSDNNLTLSGSGSITTGAIQFRGTNNVIDTQIDVSTGAIGFDGSSVSSNLIINDGYTISLSGDIVITNSNTPTITGTGNITLNGSSTQTIGTSSTNELNIATSGTRLTNLSISNTSGVNFEQTQTYTNNLNFTNSSDTITVNLDANSTITTDNDISQTSGGSSVITGDGAVILDGTSQVINSEIGTSSSDRLATLTIDSTGSITFNQDVYTSTLNITNANTINIAANKVVDTENSIDLTSKTVNIVGNSNGFSQLNASSITVDSTTIDISYENGYESLDFTGDTKYYLSDSTISGSVSDITVTEDLYLFDNSINIDNNGVYTTFSQSENLTRQGSSNGELIANASSYSGLSSEILSISNQQELSRAIESLRPMQNGAFIQENISTMQQITGTALNISNFSNFVQEQESENSHYNRSWARVFGGSNSKKDDNGVKGYDSTIQGVAGGFNRRISAYKSKNIYGIGFAYSNSDISGNSTTTNNSDKINSYHVTILNSNSFSDGLGLFNENVLIGSLNEYETNRTIKVASTTKNAKANFDGESYMAQTNLGYHIKALDRLMITPRISASYLRISQDDYQETGAGDSGLNVKSNDFDNVITRYGVDITHKASFFNTKVLTELNLYREDKLLDSYQEQSISFIGGGNWIQNNSNDIQDEVYGAGISLNFFSGKSSELNLKYDAQIGDNFTSHIGSAQYKFKF